jgi:hypothetical protein
VTHPPIRRPPIPLARPLPCPRPIHHRPIQVEYCLLRWVLCVCDPHNGAPPDTATPMTTPQLPMTTPALPTGASARGAPHGPSDAPLSSQGISSGSVPGYGPGSGAPSSLPPMHAASGADGRGGRGGEGGIAFGGGGGGAGSAPAGAVAATPGGGGSAGPGSPSPGPSPARPAPGSATKSPSRPADAGERAPVVVTPAEFRTKMSQGVELKKFNKWGWSQQRSVLIEHMEAGERMFWQKPGQSSRRDTESSIKVGGVCVCAWVCVPGCVCLGVWARKCSCCVWGC